MKISKKTKYKNKLVKLKFIKTKIYKNNNYNFIKIEDIISRLKKALHIIYKYHMNHKRILFVGTPSHLGKKFKNLIKNTRHIHVPESVWMSGILTNQQSCFKYLFKNQKLINRKVSTILVETKKKSDLIVILDSFTNSSALNEGYLTRTPVISLNSDYLDFKSSYRIPGNFKFTNKKIRNNLFYSILKTIFKKVRANSELQKRKNFLRRSPVFRYFKQLALKN